MARPTDTIFLRRDADFNRGAYAALENKWHSALKSGKRVRVEIRPALEGNSRRPFAIMVEYWIDDLYDAREFSNSYQKKAANVESSSSSLILEVQRLLEEEFNKSLKGVFLHADGGPGVMSVSIFKDFGDRVEYYKPSRRFYEALTDAWNSADAASKWRTFSFEIVKDKVEAEFKSDAEIDPDEFSFDLRERVLEEKYGRKPIIYPSPNI